MCAWNVDSQVNLVERKLWFLLVFVSEQSVNYGDVTFFFLFGYFNVVKLFEIMIFLARCFTVCMPMLRGEIICQASSVQKVEF